MDSVTPNRRCPQQAVLHWQRELDGRLIVRLRENLLDWDTVVDDARDEIQRATKRLEAALIEREKTAYQLLLLVQAQGAAA